MIGRGSGNASFGLILVVAMASISSGVAAGFGRPYALCVESSGSEPIRRRVGRNLK